MVYAVIYPQGILYMDLSVVGWRALAEAWLTGRPSQQIHVSGNDRLRLFSSNIDFCVQGAQ